MTTHGPLFTLMMGAVLAAGCSKSSADTAKPVVEGVPGHGEAYQEPIRTPLTVTSISVDPNLAKGCGITGVETFFEFDSAAVEGGEDGVLTQLATCLASGPLQGRRVELVGHADPRGPDEYNAKLGKSRAQSVQEFLFERGVLQSSMTIKSEGEQGTDPTTPAEWPYDRRVDIRLVR